MENILQVTLATKSNCLVSDWDSNKSQILGDKFTLFLTDDKINSNFPTISISIVNCAFVYVDTEQAEQDSLHPVPFPSVLLTSSVISRPTRMWIRRRYPMRREYRTALKQIFSGYNR